ncbi:PREDICTED: histone-lysine N-methyltransferase SMYD3-like, partial [Galeopterus variegatus]|uniref:Histone-lysine N-methyltransferase SMYD3-like n=1 Tax=Galeopterus variegatus TaxID=482537 RepID=A0ABM0RQ31_GALVR
KEKLMRCSQCRVAKYCSAKCQMEEMPSESEKLYSFYDLESNINKLTEDKKEGLRQLAMTFQHFMREEIQDTSQLPSSFDIFEAFAKVCLGWGRKSAVLESCYLPWDTFDGAGALPSVLWIYYPCSLILCVWVSLILITFEYQVKFYIWK